MLNVISFLSFQRKLESRLVLASAEGGSAFGGKAKIHKYVGSGFQLEFTLDLIGGWNDNGGSIISALFTRLIY